MVAIIPVFPVLNFFAKFRQGPPRGEGVEYRWVYKLGNFLLNRSCSVSQIMVSFP